MCFVDLQLFFVSIIKNKLKIRYHSYANSKPYKMILNSVADALFFIFKVLELTYKKRWILLLKKL